jgi:microcystin-dependent protein
MAFKRPKARILERTITAGNGPYTLGGAVDGSYNSFASFMAIGDVTEGYVIEPGVAFWTGILTYSATNQVTLTTVEETSGTFGAGTKEIGCGPMASKSAFPQDIAGAIVTGGSSTAYTVASYRVYDTLARLNGNIIAFTPHTTNGATVTLNVDGLGAKPLRPAPGVDLQSNVLIQGTPYLALYNHSDQVFYLHGMGGNTYGIPLAAGMDYWDTVTPSSAFAFPLGQALSRAGYAPLFAKFGTTYGAGDGSTTFNIPDKGERVSVMKAAVASRLSAPYFVGNSASIGAVGGGQSYALQRSDLPNVSPTFTGTNQTWNTNSFRVAGNATGTGYNSGGNTTAQGDGSTAAVNITPAGTVQSLNGNVAQTNIATVQPTIVCNYIIRVL